jgi:ATP-dependent RNA helicase DHX36
MSVAARVAKERGEALGGFVGYQIRLENRMSPSTQLLFCTVGILLRLLVSDPTLAALSHVIVDEVHERDRLADFLLVVLRDLVRSGKRPDLKVILMSATVDQNKFSLYFDHAPCLEIPGFTHPVEQVFLDEIMSDYVPHCMHLLPKFASRALKSNQPFSRGGNRSIKGGAEEKTKLGHRKKGDFQNEPSRVPQYCGNVKGRLLSAAVSSANANATDGITPNHPHNPNAGTESADTATADPADVPAELLAELVLAIHRRHKDEPGAAVLVFLPGWKEISAVVSRLKTDPELTPLALHSALPPAQQQLVFKPAEPGKRKVVVSTNVAETSITIEDVVFVVDSGFVNEMTYDPALHMSTLKATWISKANLSQRKGRAGRVRPGQSFHLYTRAKAEALPAFQLPELLRTPLEELCLQVKIQALGDCAAFLAKAPDPPNLVAVAAALRGLTALGALDRRERLTTLGRHVARLPMDPRLSVLLLLGAVLGVCDPALTITACLAHRSPFVLPTPEQRNIAQVTFLTTNTCRALDFSGSTSRYGVNTVISARSILTMRQLQKTSFHAFAPFSRFCRPARPSWATIASATT